MGGNAPASPVGQSDRADAQVRESLTRAGAGAAVLIQGGCVLTQDAAIGNLETGDVLIRDGKVIEVGPSIIPEHETIVIDATDAVVIPGFVDAHVHAWEGQLRGSAPALDFPAYLKYTRGGYAPHYRPHDNYAGTLATALVALDAGITTMIDNSYNNPTPEHADAAVEALIDSGIRAVYALGSPTEEASDPHWPTDALRLRERYFPAGHQRLTLRLYSMHLSPALWKFARQEDFWISTEMGDHIPDVNAKLRQMHDDGYLTARHTFNHCIQLSRGSWKLIGEAGVTVNMCPRSDATFGLGSAFPEIDSALAAGIRPGLSGDNELSYGLSMFAEMQALLIGHRSRMFARAQLTGNPGASDVLPPLTPADVFEFATVGGAANAGLSHRVGSLTPGKDADIVLIRTSDLNVAPASQALATVTSFAHSGNVDTVLVGGELRKFRGQLVGHDIAAVRRMMESSRNYLMAAQGFRPDRLAAQGAR
jgi:5-methylthioadenosine/S-adenosylhomocysteine deaminase